MPYVEARGVRIHYTETGAGDPAIIFSHGLLMDGSMFAPQLDVLAPRHRCVTWDQRGHGATEDHGEAFDYWDSARDCLAVMDALDIERAVLVGMSQGGFLSMRLALLAPERVVGLILISTQSGVDGAETIDGFRGLRAEWAANGPANVGEGVAGMLLGDEHHGQHWLKRWQAQPKSRLGPCIDTLIGRDDITDRLDEIGIPTLVVHGEADQGIPIARGRELADALPVNRGFLAVQGAAHSPNLTHPALVNPAIEDFLAGL